MNDALPSGLLVAALLRRVNDAGGFGVVRAKGEAGSGAILLILMDGGTIGLRERARDSAGRTVLRAAGPAGPSSDEAERYWRKRRAADPDLWVIELDIASAERFAAETIAQG